jgi:hypothetical protein
MLRNTPNAVALSTLLLFATASKVPDNAANNNHYKAVTEISSSPRTDTLPEFTVLCDLNTRHGGDPDRMAPKEEIRLLTDAVKKVYPLLPPHLQDVACKISFVVGHQDTAGTKLFSGFSAEDDANYKYPDTRFYNPNKKGADYGPNGTIAANFTEKTLQGLALFEELAKDHPELKVNAFIKYLIVHELRHADDWHTKPVMTNVKNHPELFKDGLMDVTLLAHLKQKIQFELDAVEMHRQYIDVEQLQLFGTLAAEYEKKNPDLFKKGAKYGLLNSTLPNSFIGRYLLGEVKAAHDGRSFGPVGDKIYYSQIRLPEIVLELKKINDHLLSNISNPRAVKDMFNTRQTVEKMHADWNKIVEDSALWARLKGNWPYLIQVQERYTLERSKFEQMSQRFAGGKHLPAFQQPVLQEAKKHWQHHQTSLPQNTR